ncbi:unnamed protein product [Camellia sinensis]
MRAVSVASPQCSSFCKDDIVPELVFKELQSSLSGHMSFHCLKDIYWDFTRPANYDSLHHSQSLVNQCRGDLLADHLTTRKCCLQAIGMARFCSSSSQNFYQFENFASTLYSCKTTADFFTM